MVKITKGLDVPIKGAPDQSISYGPAISQVALLGGDYNGMKPTMLVAEGESVKLGQPLFTDKRNSGVLFTSPASGRVAAINRGEKRRFESVIVDVDGVSAVEFAPLGSVQSLNREAVVNRLVESGLWTSLRTRPYSKIPSIDSAPRSIFVTAIDTNPLAAAPEPIINDNHEFFVIGLRVLTKLTEGPVYLCQANVDELPGANVEGVQTESFEGPHPAGLAGTHIHFLDPVSMDRVVWHINYQDVIAIGALFVTGRLSVERVVSIGGPQTLNPRLVRTRVGANLGQLLAGELNEASDVPTRIISGSPLSGRSAAAPVDFLGRYHLQVTAIKEGIEREFLGWQKPGWEKFSVKKIFASFLRGTTAKFSMTTSTEGSKRAMVPIGSYEQVMPLDILPTFLLRALIVNDTEQAQLLGCLELDEEDLALCTFVCPGKYEYGTILRDNLAHIEKEG